MGGTDGWTHCLSEWLKGSTIRTLLARGVDVRNSPNSAKVLCHCVQCTLSDFILQLQSSIRFDKRHRTLSSDNPMTRGHKKLRDTLRTRNEASRTGMAPELRTPKFVGQPGRQQPPTPRLKTESDLFHIHENVGVLGSAFLALPPSPRFTRNMEAEV